MKKFLKIFGSIVLGLLGLLGVGLIYFIFAFPKFDPAAGLKIEATPEQIARGKYLTNHVAVCID